MRTPAIVLVDHGSRRANANEVLERIADHLRERFPDRVVAVAHMELASPSITEAMDACVARGATEITVLPYFLGPGGHVGEDVPRLAREAVARHPGVTLRIAAPLGVHRALVDVVVDRVREVEGEEPEGA